MPIQKFSAISWREQVDFQWDDEDVCFNLDQHAEQTWGQLLSDVIDYITITLQFSGLHYITITSIFKCNRLNYNYFVNVIDYIADYI